MKIAVFTEDLFEDVEFWYPYYRLKEAGHQPMIIGSGKKEKHTGKHQTTIKVDLAVKDAVADTFDGVIIPGGYAPDKMRLHPEFSQLVKNINQEEKMVASLCHGPWIMASANIIDGKKITCWPSLKDDMINAGAKYIDQEVVVDRNLITSRCPDDLPAFMREVIKYLDRS
ncbi:MAG: type 1 glutamine amidotransferase [Euryarchaeota archaeon]|nr:type 1 glutamine amidotransferase [Euryarchaeota archaeon]